ncbi:hypothetical protein B0H15DRAFT_799282 [Mycena belliarum]|uniref:Uncharacterized protein n=1 Tax=Mycena belliarum TaxID=1033014 RepID=A0AAD6XU13_9AGAR|nr:hypothetical protein B0H15DRAFT_799282 [Mycena belliae]
MDEDARGRPPTTAAPERVPKSRSPTPPGAPSEAARAVRDVAPYESEARLPAAPRAEENKYAARPIERREIASDRVDWIVPPPIPRNWTKEWSKWELDEWAGETAWVGRGKKREIATEHVWYDRERGRQLFFDDLAIPDGCLDSPRYGLPVPRFPFYFDDGGSGRASKASFWMYPKKECLKREEGKRQAKPAATELPLRRDSGKVKYPPAGPDSDEDSDDDDAPELPGQGSALAKGKGKAQADAEEDADHAEVAMDVDEEPFASNVIALSGLDPQVTSLMFRSFTADALYAVRATPLAMVQGQGRMWVRFESITEARRAFGALVQMNGALAGSYEPDGAFNDAYTYSQDRWTMQTTQGLELPRLAIVTGNADAALNAERFIATATQDARATGSEERSVAASLSQPRPAATPPASTGGVERFLAAPPPASSSAAPASPLTISPVAPPLAIPRAPRSMRATENAFRRLTLNERLESSPAPAPVPLADRLTTPLAERLSEPASLAERLSNPVPLAERMDWPGDHTTSAKRARLAPTASEGEGPGATGKKKVRRGRRAGRQVREQDEIRARFRAEAEALTQRAEETGDASLLAWVPTLELAAEMEVDEEEARAYWAAGDEDMDISPAIAGPSNQKQ